jgi:hypothetical protein
VSFISVDQQNRYLLVTFDVIPDGEFYMKTRRQIVSSERTLKIIAEWLYLIIYRYCFNHIYILFVKIDLIAFGGMKKLDEILTVMIEYALLR